LTGTAGFFPAPHEYARKPDPKKTSLFQKTPLTVKSA
jgi:hypothetical protein